MTHEEQTLLMVKGLIADLTPEQAAKVNKMADEVRAAVAANGDEGYLVMALIGAELQLEAAKQGF